MKKNKFKKISGILLTGYFLMSINISYGQDWKVPEKSDKMDNPYKASAKINTIGKSLYTKYCKSCHGKIGKGDGAKAADLDASCNDFSTSKFQSQSDGSLYFKTAEGRDEMPAFKKKIPSVEDMWLVIGYLRSFK